MNAHWDSDSARRKLSSLAGRIKEMENVIADCHRQIAALTMPLECARVEYKHVHNELAPHFVFPE